MSRALRHDAFRRIAALYTADFLLEWFGSIALMVVVYRATNSASIAAVMLLCKQIAPALVLAALGTLAGEASVRQSLCVAFSAQAATLAALGLVGYGPALFPLALVSGVAGAVVRSSLRAGIAQSLSGPDLRAGNALLNVVIGVAAPVGPAVAALVVAAVDPEATLVIAAAATAFCAAAGVRVRPAGRAQAAQDDASALLDADEPAGAHRGVPLTWILALAGVVTFLFAMDQPALLAYSERSLGAGVEGYGAVVTAWGVGVTIGSILFTRLLGHPMLRIHVLATAVAGAGYLGMGAAPGLTAALGFAVVGGIGNGVSWVALVTAVQEAAPRGRQVWVSRRLEAITMAGPALGILVGGLIADALSPRLTLVVPGVLVLLVLAVGAAAFRLRDARRPAGRQVFPASIPGGAS